MFWFTKKESPKKTESLTDSRLKRLKGKSNPFLETNPISSSLIRPFYEFIYKKIEDDWEELHDKYNKEVQRRKKFEDHWNYSDMNILRDCIRKSVEEGVCFVLAQKWCWYMEKNSFEPKLKENIDNENTPESNLEDRIKDIKKEIKLFCDFLYSFTFDMYFRFFLKHYELKEGVWTREEIYKKEGDVFRMIIMNALTGLSYFNELYNKYIVQLFYEVNTKNRNKKNENNTKERFQTFLKDKLKIQENFENIYTKTLPAIWDFHSEPYLPKKIQKATKIIPCINEDHIASLNRTNTPINNQQETITRKLVQFLTEIFCPEIVSSVNYIKMLICLEKEKESMIEFDDKLVSYCILWVNERSSSDLLVIFDGCK